mmetsp:Transcript_18763/g.43851  ORF Transcript_18763/g.43851 Transcript_18763/m.43851 type:complete len:129 (+) Transcript_18763:53-439(+)
MKLAWCAVISALIGWLAEGRPQSQHLRGQQQEKQPQNLSDVGADFDPWATARFDKVFDYADFAIDMDEAIQEYERQERMRQRRPQPNSSEAALRFAHLQRLFWCGCCFGGGKLHLGRRRFHRQLDNQG